MNTKRHDRNPLTASPRNLGFRNQTTRGSVLLTALIFALIIGICITSYLQLTTTSLSLAHRTFFADAACNLAEAGTEEAVWSFNKLGYATDSTSINTAWSGWTLGNTIADVNISSMGSGYTSAPTVAFSGGGGTGAAGTATITTVTLETSPLTTVTGVTGVTITNPGSGYTSPPTVTFTGGGGGTGAAGTGMLSATRTITFNNLDQNATGVVKVWVDGCDGNATVPIVVTQATITPYQGPPITKMIKVIISRNGILPKGLVAEDGITWNGHPFADSYVSSAAAGIPPFTQYGSGAIRANITVGSLTGTIGLGNGTVDGNVDLGSGVTVTGGTVTGQTLSGMSGSFALPTYPTYPGSGTTGYMDLGSATSLPAVLPRPASGGTPADSPSPSDGKYYYFVHGATIGTTTITAGTNVVIVGDGSTSMASGLTIGVTGPSDTPPNKVGSATIYMDGPITLSGNDSVNPSSWAGALMVYTSTTSDCSFKGNAFFCGILFAPNAALTGKGGGNDSMDLSGSFVAKSVTSDGHMSFHYDENLSSINPNAKAWSLALWKEMQSASDRAIYASRLNF
jgi:hypothetical protein